MFTNCSAKPLDEANGSPRSPLGTARPGCTLGALHGRCRRKGGSRIETALPLGEPRSESGHTVTEEMQKRGVTPEEQTTWAASSPPPSPATLPHPMAATDHHRGPRRPGGIRGKSKQPTVSMDTLTTLGGSGVTGPGLPEPGSLTSSRGHDPRWSTV